MIMAMAEADPDVGAQTIMDWIAGHPVESLPSVPSVPSVPLVPSV
jgi:hypothetical protein